MVPTEVNDVLSLLKQQEHGIWFEKHFLFSLVMGRQPCKIINVNYPVAETLGSGVGTLIGKGNACRRSASGEYLFDIGKHTLALREKEQVFVVDFDCVSYCPHEQALHYNRLPLQEKKLEKFRCGLCRLLFDPYTDCSEAEWRKRQERLSVYIETGFMILDPNKNEVSFSAPGCTCLDPSTKWVATRHKTENELTHENFLREFDRLLVKYGMKSAVIAK